MAGPKKTVKLPNGKIVLMDSEELAQAVNAIRAGHDPVRAVPANTTFQAELGEPEILSGFGGATAEPNFGTPRFEVEVGEPQFSPSLLHQEFLEKERNLTPDERRLRFEIDMSQGLGSLSPQERQQRFANQSLRQKAGENDLAPGRDLAFEEELFGPTTDVLQEVPSHLLTAEEKRDEFADLVASGKAKKNRVRVERSTADKAAIEDLIRKRKRDRPADSLGFLREDNRRF